MLSKALWAALFVQKSLKQKKLICREKTKYTFREREVWELYIVPFNFNINIKFSLKNYEFKKNEKVENVKNKETDTSQRGVTDS